MSGEEKMDHGCTVQIHFDVCVMFIVFIYVTCLHGKLPDRNAWCKAPLLCPRVANCLCNRSSHILPRWSFSLHSLAVPCQWAITDHSQCIPNLNYCCRFACLFPRYPCCRLHASHVGCWCFSSCFSGASKQHRGLDKVAISFLVTSRQGSHWQPIFVVLVSFVHGIPR